MALPVTLDEVDEEWDALSEFPDDRYRLLIDLGRALPAMDPALKTEETLVRGCMSRTWLYSTRNGALLHFVADAEADIAKGLVAVALLDVQDKAASDIDIEAIKARLTRLGLGKHITSKRTQGLASMLARIGELAAT